MPISPKKQYFHGPDTEPTTQAFTPRISSPKYNPTLRNCRLPRFARDVLRQAEQVWATLPMPRGTTQSPATLYDLTLIIDDKTVGIRGTDCEILTWNILRQYEQEFSQEEYALLLACIDTGEWGPQHLRGIFKINKFHIVLAGPKLFADKWWQIFGAISSNAANESTRTKGVIREVRHPGFIVE